MKDLIQIVPYVHLLFNSRFFYDKHNIFRRIFILQNLPFSKELLRYLLDEERVGKIGHLCI